jgi:hypothetical protein
MEPFRVEVPDEVLNDLQTRLKLTRLHNPALQPAFKRSPT